MVVRDSETIIGIIPLLIRKGLKFGISVSHVSLIDELYNIHSDILLNAPTEDTIKAVVAALFSLDVKWDVFRIGRIVEDNPALELIVNHLKRSMIQYTIRREEPSFYIPLNGSFSDYLKTQSSSFRYNLKRKEKRMRAFGDLRYVRGEDAKNVDDVFNDILYIEENCWKHNEGTAITSVVKQREFFRALCARASERGWLRLRFFYIDGEPAAYNMGLVNNKKYHLLKLSYHDKYKQGSPGVLLIARLMEDLMQEGVTELDFMAEPYDYEKKWTDEYRSHVSLVMYSGTMKARLHSMSSTIRKFMRNRRETHVLAGTDGVLLPRRLEYCGFPQYCSSIIIQR
jgi:CelD/BcsL family acetyltransferase involved in cellulose biosynthesis